MKNSLKERGITLIALIITIILLIMLAGITINFLLGKNGIVEKTINAKTEYKIEEEKQKLQLAIYDLNIKKEDMTIDLQELRNINENIKILKDDEIKENVKLFSDFSGKKYAVAIVNEYAFKIYENMTIEYFEEYAEEDKLAELKEKYVQDGLIVWYDGICNDGKDHNDKANEWKNLADETENNKDNGILMNFDYNNISGWTNNSLILDGKDDWVKISYLYSENMTIEIVAKQLKETTNACTYLANYQNGGIGISKGVNTQVNQGEIYSNSKYNIISSKENNEICKIYSMSTGNNGSKMYFSQNGEIDFCEGVGTIGKPENTTIFAVGTNPNGNSYTLDSKEEFSKIEVYSVRIYNRCLSENEVKKNYESDCERFKVNQEKFNVSDLGYVEDGLICLYDGEHNNFYNHDDRINKWVDLTNNSNDGKIAGINYTNTSGWTNNSLILDGINDYVQMTYMHYNNMTVEIVFKPISIRTKKSEYYIANCESGGIALYKETTDVNASAFYINKGYNYMYFSNTIGLNKIYSLSTGYNGNEQFFMENGQFNSKSITGTYKKPDNSTVFMLATNPDGKNAGDVKTNMEVYSVRVYNRSLTKEEIYKNYQIDKKRFSI